MIPLRDFISEQRRDLPICATTEIFSEGTYIVTGANVGIGYETVKHLVGAGAKKVIIAVRNINAGEIAKAEIEAATKTRQVLEVWPLDLASYDSVKSFAKMAIDKLERIDALIENAGVALDVYYQAEGHESSTTINVYSTMLLAVLLIPKLTEDSQRFKISPHVTIVTSEAFTMAKAELDKIKENPLKKMDDPTQSNMSDRYPLTKLMQVYAVRHLATLIPVARTGVIINVVNPGMCKTTLARNAGIGFRVMLKIFHLLVGRTAEMGSRTLLYAAAAGEESHGYYTSACEVKENQVPDWAKNEEAQHLQKRIWADISQELEHAEPGCVSKIL